MEDAGKFLENKLFNIHIGLISKDYYSNSLIDSHKVVRFCLSHRKKFSINYPPFQSAQIIFNERIMTLSIQSRHQWVDLPI